MNPRCPGEMYEKLKREGYDCDFRAALISRNEYRKQQRKIQNSLTSLGCKDELPPCYDCKPEIFAYCEDTGIECKDFGTYVLCGKVEDRSKAVRMNAA